MRGKPFQLRNKVLDQRNIPAYAGKTCSGVWSPGFIKEHPRVCGENWSILQIGASWCRNIPAYAGKTAGVAFQIRVRREHPRVCGENSKGFIRVFLSVGTSPRMRGKPRNRGDLMDANRNIPAYAGKTLPEKLYEILPGEHPRVCGENIIIARNGVVFRGTSPRMRGKPSGHLAIRRSRRNIPAYAGKTLYFL